MTPRLNGAPEDLRWEDRDAARIGATVIATFDERRFRAVRPLSAATAFTLVPSEV